MKPDLFQAKGFCDDGSLLDQIFRSPAIPLFRCIICVPINSSIGKRPQDSHGIPAADLLSCYASSLASASTCAVLSAFRAEKILTVVSVNVMFLPDSSILRMVLAAMGAQEPFSIRPTVRFW